MLYKLTLISLTLKKNSNDIAPTVMASACTYNVSTAAYTTLKHQLEYVVQSMPLQQCASMNLNKTTL